MSYNARRSRLHFFESKVDSIEYQYALEQAFLKDIYDPEYLGCKRGVEYTFQQDGARGHTSNSTEGWLLEHLPSQWVFTPGGGSTLS